MRRYTTSNGGRRVNDEHSTIGQLLTKLNSDHSQVTFTRFIIIADCAGLYLHKNIGRPACLKVNDGGNSNKVDAITLHVMVAMMS